MLRMDTTPVSTQNTGGLSVEVAAGRSDRSLASLKVPFFGK
jgi:hypothetical protein